MNFKSRVQQIMDEVHAALEHVDGKAVTAVVHQLLQAKRVYVAGGGRSGLMARSFAMRLMHLGLTTYVVGETTTPSIGPDDLLVVCSGSGQTQVTVLMTGVARRMGSHVVAITANRHSPIAHQADTLLLLEAPHKKSAHDGATPSLQYAGSMFEQALLVLLDAIAMEIARKLGRTMEEMQQRHTNLE